MKKRSRSRILTALFIVFATMTNAAPTGVTVNGTALDDAVSSGGTGWTYNAPTLTLSGAEPLTLSGANTAGKVLVVVSAGATSAVTLSDLTLQTTGSGQCVFELEQNADISLFLAGTNTLASGRDHAGLEVPASASISITNAPSDAAGALTVTGGTMGAGIGGGYLRAGGTVTVHGGTVTATGGMYGAGIGGGRSGNGDAVTITGGTVFARGNNGSADIGPGFSGTASGANIFTGGSVRLANDSISPTPTDNAFQNGVGTAMQTHLPHAHGQRDARLVRDGNEPHT